MKKNEGITIVALVITIIVMLILAGITINLTIGQDGILKRAQEAGKNYTNAAEYEREQLAEFTNEVDKIIRGNVEQSNRDTEDTTTILNLTVADIFESHSGYIAPTLTVGIQKKDNIIRFSINTANGTNGTLVPSGVWTTIGVLKPEYRPIASISEPGTNGPVNNVSWWQIRADGTVQVYQASGRDYQCIASFMYFTN